MQQAYKKSILFAMLILSCNFNAPAATAAHVFRTCAAFIAGETAIATYSYHESEKIKLAETVAKMNEPFLNKVCHATSSIVGHGPTVSSNVFDNFSQACNILTTTFPCYLERISHACFMKYYNWLDPIGRADCDHLPEQSLNEAKNLGTINIVSSTIFYAAIIGGAYLAYKKGYFSKFKDYATKQNDDSDDSEEQK